MVGIGRAPSHLPHVSRRANNRSPHASPFTPLPQVRPRCPAWTPVLSSPSRRTHRLSPIHHILDHPYNILPLTHTPHPLHPHNILPLTHTPRPHPHLWGVGTGYSSVGSVDRSTEGSAAHSTVEKKRLMDRCAWKFGPAGTKTKIADRYPDSSIPSPIHRYG